MCRHITAREDVRCVEDVTSLFVTAKLKVNNHSLAKERRKSFLQIEIGLSESLMLEQMGLTETMMSNCGNYLLLHDIAPLPMVSSDRTL